MAGLRLECVADLIGIRTAAVEPAMEMPQMILRATDGQGKWYQAAESRGFSGVCVAFIRLIPQINPKCAQRVHHVFSTKQSG